MSESKQLQAGDEVRRFIVENQPVRGHWVRLDAAWRELCAHADYPAARAGAAGAGGGGFGSVRGHAEIQRDFDAATAGDGAVSLLVAQCTHDFRLRAVARFDATRVAEIRSAGSPRRFGKLVGTTGGRRDR